VEAGDRIPGRAAIVRAKHRLRRGPRVPGARLRGVARREPERVVDGTALLPLGRFRERRRPLRLLPALAEVRRAEDGRTEVSGLGRGEERAPVAWIEDQVVDDVPEEVRTVDPPLRPRRIAMKQPGSLA